MSFISPTKGKLELPEVVLDIMGYMSADSRFSYRLIIGTDSQTNRAVHGHKDTVDFVSAVVVHRVGRGGRYFWQRIHREYANHLPLKARIFVEANLSIELAVELLQKLQHYLAEAFVQTHPSIEVHIDVGQNGPTRDMIKELVGLVKSNGFEARIKPEAYAASTVADKYA